MISLRMLILTMLQYIGRSVGGREPVHNSYIRNVLKEIIVKRYLV